MPNEKAAIEAPPFRILALDGGGAKGFYTLGILEEIEALIRRPVHEGFDLIYGTSTGAIIATLLARGDSVETVYRLYKAHVPAIMSCNRRSTRTRALESLAREVYGESDFGQFKTGIGVVTANWKTEKPMIFKGSREMAHGRKSTFTPGFGVTVADAVQASCSAFPFFERKIVTTEKGDDIELVDGGYCANNPTLYAIADAVRAGERNATELRVVSLGVGAYPAPRNLRNRLVSAVKMIPFNSIELLQKTLEINTQSMDQLRSILYSEVPTVRISDAYTEPEMATDLLERDLVKLNVLRQRGRESFAKHEAVLRQFLT